MVRIPTHQEAFEGGMTRQQRREKAAALSSPLPAGPKLQEP
ncbi:hypothetical protein [[Phormidium] sp. ETS-05]|nr:hypothetical protein [[Phormidium] sp. ETS-05]